MKLCVLLVLLSVIAFVYADDSSRVEDPYGGGKGKNMMKHMGKGKMGKGKMSKPKGGGGGGGMPKMGGGGGGTPHMPKGGGKQHGGKHGKHGTGKHGAHGSTGHAGHGDPKPVTSIFDSEVNDMWTYSYPDPNAISYPPQYAPENMQVHVINTITATITPDVVWGRLIDAENWPNIYANAQNVAIEGGGDDLYYQAHFTWKTFGINLDSVVMEWVPNNRIAWLAKGLGCTFYHAFLITYDDDTGLCTVLTEETQKGLGAVLSRKLYPNRMETWHQKWLEALTAPEASNGN